MDNKMMVVAIETLKTLKNTYKDFTVEQIMEAAVNGDLKVIADIKKLIGSLDGETLKALVK